MNTRDLAGTIQLINSSKSIESLSQEYIDHVASQLTKNTVAFQMHNEGMLQFASRARVIKEPDSPFSLVKEMLQPPPELAPLGRCNEKGKPVLYASMREENAIAEARVNPGDYVQTVEINFEITHATHIGTFASIAQNGSPPYPIHTSENPYHYFTEFKRISNRLERKKKWHKHYMSDSFMADLLGKNNDDLPGLYRLTSAISRGFFKHFSVLVYPSVKSLFGRNYAIDTDRVHVSATQSSVYRVLEANPYGTLLLQKIKTATSHANVAFKWSKHDGKPEFLPKPPRQLKQSKRLLVSQPL